MTTWRALPRWARIALGVYAGAFLVATVSHIVDIVVHGDSVYAAAPPQLRLFFVSLVVLDPVVVALVLRMRRAGVLLAVAVMLADVTANVAMSAIDPTWRLAPTLPVFGVFVVVTALPLWRSLAPPRARSVPPHPLVH